MRQPNDGETDAGNAAARRSETRDDEGQGPAALPEPGEQPTRFVGPRPELVPAAPRSAPPSGAGRSLPDRIGPYRVLRELGRGGMGTVYLGEREGPVRIRAAVKLVSAPMRDDLARRRFETEQRAMARLSHPHIAKLFDAGTRDDGFPWFAMELVDGQPVTVDADAHRSDPRERVQTMARVCRAVEHAHRRGILHRDLKPSNILVERLDGEPTPRIIDFGIAKALDDPLSDRTLTANRMAIGTPAYMAPETVAVILGEGDLDTRSDVYSLGVILYEILAGTRPHPERALEQWIRGNAKAPPRPSVVFASLDEEAQWSTARARRSGRGSLVRQLEGDLGWIAWRAVAPDREDRYPSAAALASDLEAWLEGRPVEAHPPTFGYRARKLVQRHRAAALASAIALLALLFGLAGTSTGFVRASREAERAASEAARASREAATANQVAGFLEDLFESSDPSLADGRDITARDLLRRGAERLGEGLGEDRLLAGRLTLTVARVHGKLGEHDEAVALARRTLDLYEAGNAGTAARAEALAVLGNELARIGRVEDGVRALRDSLAMRRADANVDELVVARVLVRLGGVLSDAGRAAEAEPLLEEALVIRSRHPGREPEAVGSLLNSLGVLRGRDGRDAEARDLFERGLALLESSPARDPIAQLSLLGNLAIAQERLGSREEAEASMRESIAIARRIFEPPHPRLALALGNLGQLLLHQGRLDDAEALLRESLEMFLEVHRHRAHVELGRAWLLMTELRLAQGRDRDASHAARASSKVMEEALGSDRLRVAGHENSIGWAYLLARRYEEAEAHLRSALAAFEAAPGSPADPMYANVLNNLARVRLTRGAPEEAEALVRRALELRERVLGPEHPHTVLAKVWLARTLVALDRDEEALPLFEAASSASGSTAGAFEVDAVRRDLAELQERLRRATHAQARPTTVARSAIPN